jgi:hypothetical protein
LRLKDKRGEGERSENGLMSLNCVDFLKCPFHGEGWLFLNSGKHKPFFMGNINKKKQWRPSELMILRIIIASLKSK